MEALDRNGISEKLDSISTTDRNYTDNDALLSEEDSELSSKAFKSRSRSFLITCGACGAHVVMVLIYLSWTMALLKHKSWLMECKPGPDLIYCQHITTQTLPSSKLTYLLVYSTCQRSRQVRNGPHEQLSFR